MSDETVEEVLRDEELAGLFVWCEGCDSRHYIPVKAEVGSLFQQTTWEFDGNNVSPTFSPSILIYEYTGHHPRCHSFIRNGNWEYLGDCTHALKDTQRVLLKRNDWPEDEMEA